MTIEFEGNVYEANQDEAVLDCLLRHGVNLRFSCKKGNCQTCLMILDDGVIKKRSEHDLPDDLTALDYFLPCDSLPGTDLKVRRPDDKQLFHSAKVVEKVLVTHDICRLRVVLDASLDYMAGQYVNLRLNGLELMRPYSLCSLPLVDTHLEFHIKRVAHGYLSNLIFNQLSVHDEIQIQSPTGSCVYEAGDKTMPLVLVAGGTGAGALWGIAREALMIHGHKGSLTFFHLVSTRDEAYLRPELDELKGAFSNFKYHVLDRDGQKEPIHILPKDVQTCLSKDNWTRGTLLYTCGSPRMVKSVTDFAIQQGVEMSDIFLDAFDFQHYLTGITKPIKERGGEESTGADYEHREEVFKFPKPDPGMWQALGHGDLLRDILTDFYTKVYSDKKLSPFFKGVTKQRAIEKQYNFLNQYFTGENIYLGHKPRNAHHWMVISNELFDYRENLLVESMRKFNLEAWAVDKWKEIDESFRDRIVKDRPWNKIFDGQVIPVDGFEKAVLEVAALCDYCHSEVMPGEQIHYHRHEAKVYCPKCYGGVLE